METFAAKALYDIRSCNMLQKEELSSKSVQRFIVYSSKAHEIVFAEKRNVVRLSSTEFREKGLLSRFCLRATH